MIVTSSVLVIMVVVTMISVIKVLLMAAAVINMVVVVDVLVMGVLADVEIMVVGAIVVALEFALACSVADMDVDLFMGALAGARIGVLPGLCIEVLADVSANAFEVVTALNFPM